MNRKELEAFAREAAKSLKTEKDLNAFSQMLTKIAVEAALNAELDEQLGYDRHQASDAEYSRNVYSSMILMSEVAQYDISISRYRNCSDEPQISIKQLNRM